jgi:hypothetical protein
MRRWCGSIPAALLALWNLLAAAAAASGFAAAAATTSGCCHEGCRFLLYTVNPVEGFNLQRDVYGRATELARAVQASPGVTHRWTLVLPRWRTPHWGRGGGAWAAPGLPWSKFFELGPIRRYMHPVSVMEYDQYVTLRQKCGLPPGVDQVRSDERAGMPHVTPTPVLTSGTRSGRLRGVDAMSADVQAVGSNSSTTVRRCCIYCTTCPTIGSEWAPRRSLRRSPTHTGTHTRAPTQHSFARLRCLLKHFLGSAHSNARPKFTPVDCAAQQLPYMRAAAGQAGSGGGWTFSLMGQPAHTPSLSCAKVFGSAADFSAKVWTIAQRQQPPRI